MSQKTKILIVGIPVICILVAIAIPNFFQSRVFISKNSCINLLREIEGAKDTWMQERHKTTNDTPTWNDLRPYLREPVPLECPDGGVYKIGRMNEMPTCSIAWHTEYWRTNHP